MKLLIRCAWLLVLVGLAGCASPPPMARTGNLLVDGPKLAAQGPQKDQLLWLYRTAAAALRQGDWELAKRMLDEALLTLGGMHADDPSARAARGLFTEESKKNFLGEPYERSMAYFYRGLLYWMDGQPDNARACFRSAEFIDGDTADGQYAGDWVLFDYLDGLATAKLGGDGSAAAQRAIANAKGITLPPLNAAANTLFFIEFGPGPIKYAAGQYGEQLKFRSAFSRVRSARIEVNGLTIPVAPTDDLSFQATTRGGRVMDHILGNKAVFKSTTDTIGNAAMIGGALTAIAADGGPAQNVGIGIALAGLVSKLVSAATKPNADVRCWDNLPQFLSFAAFPLPPGQHNARVEFLDGAGHLISGLTKRVQFTVPPVGDKVVFVSDTSLPNISL
jgi:tetratricopeptide (TPR) repeat protein